MISEEVKRVQRDRGRQSETVSIEKEGSDSCGIIGKGFINSRRKLFLLISTKYLLSVWLNQIECVCVRERERERERGSSTLVKSNEDRTVEKLQLENHGNIRFMVNGFESSPLMNGFESSPLMGCSASKKRFSGSWQCEDVREEDASSDRCGGFGWCCPRQQWSLFGLPWVPATVK